MIIANTKKGQGSKLIEDQRLWHYRVPKGEELDQIKKDLNS
jgi:transketolase